MGCLARHSLKHPRFVGEQPYFHGRTACVSRLQVLLEPVRRCPIFCFHDPSADTLRRIKVAVFTLLRAFEFELAVPAEDIGKSSTVLARPMRLSDPDKGPQLPMLVRACTQD